MEGARKRLERNGSGGKSGGGKNGNGNKNGNGKNGNGNNGNGKNGNGNGNGQPNGNGSGGSVRNNAGTGSGGNKSVGADDGTAMEETRLHGQLDSKGNMGKGVEFKGVPSPGESKIEFDDAVKRAAGDAEDSIGKEEVPPDARPYVRRYFENLKKK